MSREIKRVQQFFRAAVRRKLIAENPFADLATPAQVNNSREFFVSREVIDDVIPACPDNESQIIVALSRYGGLRCPSEHLALTWGDVDWENDRITVRSPKTEHHPGGESRVIPLFPEVRPYLERAFDDADDPTGFVIHQHRRTTNWRTQFGRIITRAGQQPWPRLFHNLRASRQTELTAILPLHVVCTFLGNSAVIANRHYLTVQPEHFAKALEEGAKSGAMRAQKEAQHTDAADRMLSSETEARVKKARENRAVLPVEATGCDAPRGGAMGQ